MNTPRSHYDIASQVFHWLTAMAVLTAFILGPEHFGRAMRQGMDPATHWDIVLHESLGLLVMALSVLRLVWWVLRPAKPRFDMPGWMQKASQATHGLLWVLLLAVPLSALLALGGKGHPLTLLGGLRIDVMPWITHSALVELTDWGDMHSLLGDAILWLSGLHAVAAIFHHFVLKDGVLRSMLPTRKKAN